MDMLEFILKKGVFMNCIEHPIFGTDTLHNVFEHLNPWELTQVRGVCSRFREIADSPGLYQDKQLFLIKKTYEEYVNFRSRYEALRMNPRATRKSISAQDKLMKLIGGQTVFNNLPIIEFPPEGLSCIKLEKTTAPMMRGYFPDGKFFIIIRYLDETTNLFGYDKIFPTLNGLLWTMGFSPKLIANSAPEDDQVFIDKGRRYSIGVTTSRLNELAEVLKTGRSLDGRYTIK